jgi:3'-phosphoadenosine 5'-phosphosulfate sulfotransferase (PAPS reductase)/FAD synthetase
MCLTKDYSEAQIIHQSNSYNMLTVLSFGAGQDSTYILYRIVYDRDFRREYVKGRLVVVMSDTGDEHDETYEHVEFITRFCQQHNIEFYFLRTEDGYHPNSWPNLFAAMERTDSIMSVAFNRTCTFNLKIVPVYNFLETWIAKRYYGKKIIHSKSRKAYIKNFAKDYQKIRVIIGIAKGEEERLSEEMPLSWMRKSIERVYPLIEEGIDRQGCQDYINSLKLPLPLPSNCMCCMYLSLQELLWLYRNKRSRYERWVLRERKKIEKWDKRGLPREKNLGVFGEKLLPEKLAEAQEKYGHWTNEQLYEYKMSHGHCVKSGY